MNKTLVWIIAVVVLILGGLTAVRLASRPTGSTGGSELTIPVSENDHVRGTGDIVLVEYSDFQCPACATYEPAIQQLFRDLPGKFKLVYRNFPLRQVHPNGQLAGQAAEAASLQGKFWEMHDLLFAKQQEWAPLGNPTEQFVTYAGSLGLDTAKFRTDLTSDAVKQKVNSDFNGGMDMRVNSTPTFFLNGKKLTNPQNYQQFKSMIESAGGANANATTTNE